MKKSLRKRVKERAQYLCEYCLSPERFCPTYYEGDHITPESAGGKDTFENLANACGGCNNNKSNLTHAIDTLTGQLVPLYNPRVHIWEDHFCWNDTFILRNCFKTCYSLFIALLEMRALKFFLRAKLFFE